MSTITTHVLDTALGKPGAGIGVTLEHLPEGEGHWKKLATSTTNADGRIMDLLAKETRLTEGIYRLTFETGAYFSAQGKQTFYPRVMVLFELYDPSQHYHVPLLVSPFGYSTYRGS